MAGSAHALRVYYLATFAALGVYLPYIPRWLEAQGVQGAAMGAIAAVLPAMGIVAPPVFGLIADALRLRRALLRVACAGAFAAFATIAASALAGRSLGALGIGLAFMVYAFFRAPMAMMADVMALEAGHRSGARYGRIRLFGSMGFLLAVLLAGRYLDLRALAPVPLAIAGCLLGALITSFVMPGAGALPPPPARGQIARLWGDRGFRLFLACAALHTASYACYDLCLSLHLRDLGASDRVVGLAWAIGVLFEVALMAKADALFERAPLPALLTAAYAATALRWALISGLTSPLAILLLQPMHAVSFALSWVAMMALVRQRAPEGALATAQGLLMACCAIGGATAMPIWGALYRHAGGPIAFGGAALVAACAMTLSLWLGRRFRAAAARASGDERATRPGAITP